MNQELQDYARKQLKDGLAKCTGGQQLVFKRMYANGNLDKPIEAVIDDMPVEKLDWAMQQVSNTLAKFGGSDEQ